MTDQFEIEWHDSGREPEVAPNPDYPDGKDVDISQGVTSCQTALPYPAKRCGHFVVTCTKCGNKVGLTTAGRPDDPRSLRMPCQVQGTPLLIGEAEEEALHALRELASQHPVDMRRVMKTIRTEQGMRKHKAQMTRQTVVLPMAYAVTFSIETGHPSGTCRHMSMSSARQGYLPRPEAVWMVAELLGFGGGLAACHVWMENLQGHGSPDADAGTAVNVVQPLRVETESRA